VDVVVYSSLNPTQAHLVRSLLICEGIPSRMRHGLLSSLAGELPMDACRAEILVRAEDREAAEALVAEAEAPQGEDRPCPACAEENPAGFELCWRCGCDLPPAQAAPRLRLVHG
jgi:hypothetical protein